MIHCSQDRINVLAKNRPGPRGALILSRIRDADKHTFFKISQKYIICNKFKLDRFYMLLKLFITVGTQIGDPYELQSTST